MTIPYKEKAEALEKENKELQETIDFLLARCANLTNKVIELKKESDE